MFNNSDNLTLPFEDNMMNVGDDDESIEFWKVNDIWFVVVIILCNRSNFFCYYNMSHVNSIMDVKKTSTSCVQLAKWSEDEGEKNKMPLIYHYNDQCKWEWRRNLGCVDVTCYVALTYMYELKTKLGFQNTKYFNPN
jgi:hypothetical protein